MGPLLSTHSFWPRAPLGQGVRMSTKVTVSEVCEPAAGATPSQRRRVQNPEGLCSPPHSLCCGLGGLPTESGCLACSGSPLETPEQGGSQTPPPSGSPRPLNYGKGWARPSWSWKLGEQAGGAGFHWGDHFILGDGAPPPSHGQRRLCAEEVTGQGHPARPRK